MSPKQLTDLLDDALFKFKSVSLPEPPREVALKYREEDRWIPYLAPVYTLYPDAERALLGKGGYGAAYKVKSTQNPNEPARVVKVIVKARVCTNPLQIQHMCAELAVSGLINHPNLNHRTGLYHTPTHMFIMLEMCGGPRPDVLTRVAHIIANRKPSRIPEIEAIVEHWATQAKEQSVNVADQSAFNDFVEKTGLINRLAVECGVSLQREKAELPVSTDLFGLIVANKKLTDPATQVIARGTLLGMNALHQAQIVHRDGKTENVIIGITRKATISADKKSVSFEEKYDVKVIDFGLAKFVSASIDDTAFGQTVTPGGYIRASEQAAKAVQAAEPADPFADSDAIALAEAEASRNSTGLAAPGVFNVAVTPAMTEIYAPAEVLRGVLAHGVGRHKWTSTNKDLMKVDVYGVGCCLFCCVNGRPPTRPPPPNLSREEKLRQIERAILVGPTYSSTVSPLAKEFITKLMVHDVNLRPTCDQALNEKYVSGVGDTVMTLFSVDGSSLVSLVRDKDKQTRIAVEKAEDSEEPYDIEAAKAAEAAVLAAARHREDAGDSDGKAAAGH